MASGRQGQGSQSLAGLGELAIRHVLAHFSCTLGKNEGGQVRSRSLWARPSMHLRTGPSLTVGGERGEKLGVDKGLGGVLASDHACGGRARIGGRRYVAAALASAERRSARTHEEDKGVDDHEEAVAELDHACDVIGTVSR